VIAVHRASWMNAAVIEAEKMCKGIGWKGAEWAMMIHSGSFFITKYLFKRVIFASSHLQQSSSLFGRGGLRGSYLGLVWGVGGASGSCFGHVINTVPCIMKVENRLKENCLLTGINFRYVHAIKHYSNYPLLSLSDHGDIFSAAPSD
jgi:hypothetical protein